MHLTFSAHGVGGQKHNRIGQHQSFVLYNEWNHVPCQVELGGGVYGTQTILESDLSLSDGSHVAGEVVVLV